MTNEELQNLVKTLEEMPEFLLRLTRHLSPEELRLKPSANEFSIQENVWHLRDIETEGYMVRIEKLLSENYPGLADINGARLAAERDYNNLSFTRGLEEFISTREKNINRIKELTPEQLNLVGTFDNSTEISLARVLTMMREHDADHRKELNELAG